MATATGLTAARMLEIEAASVVDGDVVGDNLILVRHDGSTTNAGNVRGPAGPPGSGGGTSSTVVEFNFATASTTWTLNHNLGFKYVEIILTDPSGNVFEGDITYVDNNTATVHFYIPISGKAEVKNS